MVCCEYVSAAVAAHRTPVRDVKFPEILQSRKETKDRLFQLEAAAAAAPELIQQLLLLLLSRRTVSQGHMDQSYQLKTKQS